MTDYVRELQSLELALARAREHGDDDAVRRIRGQIPGAVATCRRELARLEDTPQNYGSAAYAQDVDTAARLRAALAPYGSRGSTRKDEDDEDGEQDGKKTSSRRSRKETTQDTTPKETT